MIYPANKEMPFKHSKVIAWIPDFQHNHYPQYFTDSEIEVRNRLYNKIAWSKVPLVLSSNDSLNDFQKFYAKKENSYVVPFVSYIEKVISNADEIKLDILERYKLKGVKYACVMNQFWKHKNHIVVCEAIQEYVDVHPNTDMMFVFTGKMDDYRNPDYIDCLKHILSNDKVLKHIKLIGFIDRTEQIEIMKNAAFVIQPSLFEGWGTVVEDAKVLDKTILLSDIPVHYEQMNEKCILFDPHDPLALADLIYQESQKEHHDDIEKGIADMHKRAKEYSKGFEQLLRDLEKKK